eukprot:scaffold86203_cov34-Tisochrysis_lutea.AAC.3
MSLILPCAHARKNQAAVPLTPPPPSNCVGSHHRRVALWMASRRNRPRSEETTWIRTGISSSSMITTPSMISAYAGTSREHRCRIPLRPTDPVVRR